MGMPAPSPITTIEELLALPEDGLRHELLDGVHVVTPAPARVHQRVLRRLDHALQRDIGDDASVEILYSPADIRLSANTLVQPDLFVVPKPVDPSKDTWEDTPVPLLAVEILSPSTASRDRGVKRRLYLQGGVEEYWIVDIDGRVIERWHVGDERPEIADRSLEWSLSAGVGGVVEVASLFEV
jgi:Uma2 family endonuclease